MRAITSTALAAALVAVLAAVPAGATSYPQRTLILSTAPAGGAADGNSERPVLSASGRVLAFDTTATNLAGEGQDANGAVHDIVAIDLATNERRLVSAPPGAPGGANGDSLDPVMSHDGQRIAFTSLASNLVAGDTNGVADVLLRQGRDALQRVSVGAAGAQANGPSGTADASGDGSRVVFTSEASNLVPDDSNGLADVFVRDLRAGTTQRVSVSSSGAQGNGRSGATAISADGRYVAFVSVATNLVARDNNAISDVFVRDLRTRKTERVSIATGGRQQNKSASLPFVQIADISGDGRYVAFDSDATTLYDRDINQHTDVYLRDRKLGTTTLVSASSTNVQGNNDSFAPRISADGRFLTFQSYASNLAPGDGPREDIFLRDLRQGTTSTVTVTSDGSPRGPEQVPQLLQRPAVSDDGTFAAFSSTVTNLVAGDQNGAQDVFVRLLDPPVGRLVSAPGLDRSGTVSVTADDPLARTFVCQFDSRQPFICGPEIKVRRGDGARLFVRAGGPGMLFDEDAIMVPLTSDTRGPTVTIKRPTGHRIAVLRGRARDRSGVASVEVGITYLAGKKGCRYLQTRNAFSKRASYKLCSARVFVKARGTRTWRLRLPRSVRGPYQIVARATDAVGNVSAVEVLKGVIV